MNEKQKRMFYRIVIAAALMIALAGRRSLGLDFLPQIGGAELALYIVPYLIIGYDILRKAFLGLKNGEAFDENLLMAIATVGAMALGEYTEGVAVMLFYQIGELFQSYAVGKSRRSITELMDIRPDHANLVTDTGVEVVDPDEVEIGSLILVQPGEKIPLDGVIEVGATTIDARALTGESMPRQAAPGDEVLSGCINMSGVIRVRTTKEADESTAAKILDMVENSSLKKSRSENFITRFARWYTPLVCVCAVALALGAPLFRTAVMGLDPAWAEWIERALILLVISCPCALVISIPLSFFGGIGGASSRGILVKGSSYLEMLAGSKIFVFDKTGTLTKGEFRVNKIVPVGMTADELLRMAALVESHSNHPISLSLKTAYGKAIAAEEVEDYEEIGGFGVQAVVDGVHVAAGNLRLMEKMNLPVAAVDEPGTIVYVAVGGKYAGYIVISDTVKDGSSQAIRGLHAAGVRETVMLTGDTAATARAVAEQLGLDSYKSGLLPGDKVTEVENLMARKKVGERLAFVGDGVNDAPVLSRADVGIAMGALGSDAAIEAADIVLMDDDPAKIPLAMRIARKTLAIVRQNIVLAIGVKAICLIMGGFGMADMWFAIFADVGVMVIAVLNAIRALRVD